MQRVGGIVKYSLFEPVTAVAIAMTIMSMNRYCVHLHSQTA